MAAVITPDIIRQTDQIIAVALLSGAYYCESCTYGISKNLVPVMKNAHSRNYGPFKTKNKKHEPKLIKNIQIEHFSDTNLFLTIEYKTNQSPIQQCSISRAAFEQWLYQTARLDWCLTEIKYKHEDLRLADKWIYAQYGISKQDLITYLIDTRSKHLITIQ